MRKLQGKEIVLIGVLLLLIGILLVAFAAPVAASTNHPNCHIVLSNFQAQCLNDTQVSGSIDMTAKDGDVHGYHIDVTLQYQYASGWQDIETRSWDGDIHQGQTRTFSFTMGTSGASDVLSMRVNYSDNEDHNGSLDIQTCYPPPPPPPPPPDTDTPTMTTPPTFPPTETPTVPPPPTATPPPQPTETPKPPKPGDANDKYYPGTPIGSVQIGTRTFLLYNGVGASDGTLLLPNKILGAVVYNRIIWVHRSWYSGWLYISTGDKIVLKSSDGSVHIYRVISDEKKPYGVYFDTPHKIGYIATCFKVNGEWAGIELYGLKLIYVYIPHISHHR